MNYTEFVLRKQLRQYTTYIRRNQQGYRLYNGKLIPEEDFQRINALPVRCYISSTNPCRKGQYLDV